MGRQEPCELLHMEIQSIIPEKEQPYASAHDYQVPNLRDIQNPSGHWVKQSAPVDLLQAGWLD